MNIKKIMFITLMIFTFISCEKQDKKNNINTIKSNAITIDLSKFKDLAENNKSIIENISLFQLETNEKNLIGTVNKVMATKNNILILDSRSLNSVFNFDQSGKYLRKIGDEGHGPHEYNFLSDIDIDTEGNVHFLDLRLSKVLKYNNKGEYLSEQKFGFITYKFAVLDSNSYIFDQGTRDNSKLKNEVDFDYKLVCWNPKLHKLNKFIPFNEIYDFPRFPLPSAFHIYRSNNELNYLKPYEYNIYKLISADKIKKTYHLDFGKYSTPKSFYSSYSDTKKAMKLLPDLLKSDYVYRIVNIFETSKYLCFNFKYGKLSYWCAISKTDNSIYVRKIDYKAHLNYYLFLLKPDAVIDNQFITVLENQDISYLINEYGGDKLNELGLSVLTEHKSSMNPIIVKWNLKDVF